MRYIETGSSESKLTSSLATLGAALVVALGSSPAQAQGVSGQAVGADDYVGFEHGLTRVSLPGDASYWMFSPRLDAAFSPTQNLVLEAGWGLGILHVTAGGDSETEVRVGNPSASASFRLDLGASELLVGGGVALPVAQIGDDDPFADLLTLGAAAAQDGLWNLWEWVPETLTIYAPAQWSARLGDVRLGAEGALALYIPTSDDADTEVGFQVAGEAAYGRGGSEVGVRLQLASVLTGEENDGLDATQLAIAPFGKLDFGTGYVHGRLVLNLDEPNGFAFDDGGVWALFTGVGFYL